MTRVPQLALCVSFFHRQLVEVASAFQPFLNVSSILLGRLWLWLRLLRCGCGRSLCAMCCETASRLRGLLRGGLMCGLRSCARHIHRIGNHGSLADVKNPLTFAILQLNTTRPMLGVRANHANALANHVLTKLITV